MASYFFEYCKTQSLKLDGGRLKASGFTVRRGFGLRAVCDEATGYAHASQINAPSLRRAGDIARSVRANHSPNLAISPSTDRCRLYPAIDPASEVSFPDNAKTLSAIDSYARGKDPRVRQVAAEVSSSWQVVLIIRPDGLAIPDVRPLSRLNVSITAANGQGAMETGVDGGGDGPA